MAVSSATSLVARLGRLVRQRVRIEYALRCFQFEISLETVYFVQMFLERPHIDASYKRRWPYMASGEADAL